MQRNLQRNNIVLLGVGHTNAHILKMWRMKPIDNANLICVSDFPVVTYSGMLPGVLSGQYDPEQMQIDLVRLCTVNGARLIVDRVTKVSTGTNELLFNDRPPLRYDFLSIGIGSRPSMKGVQVSEDANLVPIKPMQTFLRRLKIATEKALQARQEKTASDGKKITVNIVGAGVGGTEVAFCLTQRLIRDYGKGNFTVRIICGSTIGKGLLPKTVEHIRSQMQKYEIQIFEQRRVSSVDRDGVVLTDGTRLDSDISMWVTSAEATPFLREIDLPHCDRGFLLTRPSLQSTTRDNVFAVGDSGTLEKNPTDKAGVFAVRQGPVLWENLNRSVQGKQLSNFKPQRSYLKLVNIGDGKTIAEFKGRSMLGPWAWSLKDRIDQRFMKMYQDYRPMDPAKSPKPEPDDEMRCLGCGGKLGGLSLRNALARLDIKQNDKVIVGLEKSDDAAIIKVENNQTTVTADFFAAPFDDPFTMGRVAALNSASDCFAMNARATAALTLAQVPLGHPRAQSDVLLELVAGAQHEFEKMDVSIVGGHTIEGPRLTIGFTVLADQLPGTTQKGNLKVGDQLILSKRIGTGILLAALMRGMCRAGWHSELIKTMTVSNYVALELVQKFPVSALTDVTGFGLGGHLLEMLDASQLAANVKLDLIPQIPGVSQLMELDVESTLAGENRELMSGLKVKSNQQLARLLYDPQTAGGLLFGIEESKADAAIQFLKDQGCPHTCRIGEVVALDNPATDDSSHSGKLFAS